MVAEHTFIGAYALFRYETICKFMYAIYSLVHRTEIECIIR